MKIVFRKLTIAQYRAAKKLVKTYLTITKEDIYKKIPLFNFNVRSWNLCWSSLYI